MAVARERISVNALACVGSRCCTSTNAMPVSFGKCLSNLVNASSPPADAPMPTTGKGSPVETGRPRRVSGAVATGFGFFVALAAGALRPGSPTSQRSPAVLSNHVRV